MSAGQLAAELEVSPRTVYRDVDDLSAAGIPIASERGPHGGFHLLDGYRTRLTGLTGQEAESLAFAGLPEPAAELGLDMVLASAQLKLLAALPAETRDRAERVRERFHVDAPGWFQEADQTPFLATVARAVWDEQALRLRYRRWTGEVEVTVGPLGVVLKGVQWYLVAHVTASNELRTFRVSRILELEELGESFARPPGFDLNAYWHDWSRQFEIGLYQTEALVRLSPRAMTYVPRALDPIPAQAIQASAGTPAADGWREAIMPIEGIDHAVSVLLRFGAEIEVLAPPQLRQAMARMTGAMAALYVPSPIAAATETVTAEAPSSSPMPAKVAS
jgi:predicted DNA-binding transcriptional regulator YafY